MPVELIQIFIQRYITVKPQVCSYNLIVQVSFEDKMLYAVGY